MCSSVFLWTISSLVIIVGYVIMITSAAVVTSSTKQRGVGVKASGSSSAGESRGGYPGVRRADQDPQLNAEARYTGESANVSRLLDSLLLGYDKRLRPNYNGNPVEVGITMFISSVSSMSEVNMDYTLDFYFRQHWHDPRLNFTDEEDELCIGNEMLERIWWPDTFFANAKLASFHTATTKNAFLRIKPTGWITLSLRLTVTSMCPMDLTFFPMDTQICSLEIESYAYSVNHITYKWKDGPKESVGIDRTVQMPQFSVKGYRATNKLETLSTGNYSRLACQFYFVRSLGYYIIHMYIPSCLIVVLSWISFWLHRDASPARVALGITTVLTMTTLISSSNASLPKISYLKSIDVYLVSCFFMVFASLFEYACVSYLANRKWKPRRRRGSDENGGFSGAEMGDGRRCTDGGGSECCGTHCRVRRARTSMNGPGGRVCEFNMEPLPTEVRLKYASRPEVDVRTPLTCSPLAAASQCPAHSGKLHPFPKSNQKPSTPTPITQGSGSERSKVTPNIRLACSIDKYSRAVFPLVFTAFNFTYWIVFINISPIRNEIGFVF